MLLCCLSAVFRTLSDKEKIDKEKKKRIIRKERKPLKKKKILVSLEETWESNKRLRKKVWFIMWWIWEQYVDHVSFYFYSFTWFEDSSIIEHAHINDHFWFSLHYSMLNLSGTTLVGCLSMMDSLFFKCAFKT